MVVTPYTEIVQGRTRTRTFESSVDGEELVWHRDHNDRAVMPVSGKGWKIQLDNKLPIPLNINESIYVPKNVYHRLIKGRSTENLVVEVTEYAEGWGKKIG